MSENNGTTATPMNEPFGDQVNRLVVSLGEMVVVVGRAAGKAAENLSGLVVVHVEAKERADLDALVEAGLAKTRAEAALRLLADGVKTNDAFYQRVERTRNQIEALKGQLKGLVG
jgi:hypothetical protein